jgi:hypothetical protein
MSVTGCKVVATVLLMVLTGAGAYPSEAGNEDGKGPDEARIVRMFPDGVEHDFGTVQRGTLATCTFRIVNTSNVPLKIVSYLTPSMSPLSATVTRSVLQPNETGKLEIYVDTHRFSGKRTWRVKLETENGKPMVTEFRITADSQGDLQP